MFKGTVAQRITLHTMLTPTLISLLLFFLLPLSATTSGVVSKNALAFIEAESDLTLIAALIRRDPVLVKLFSTVKDATIVAAVDSGFGFTDPNNIIYSNRAAVRAVLQDTIIRGLHPTSAITKNPIYPSTFLTNQRLLDTSRGRATAKLVEIDGKKTVDVGAGLRANITQGVGLFRSQLSDSCGMLMRRQDFRFKGVILHKISNPLDAPASFTSIASRLNLTAITRLTGGPATIFQAVAGSKDTTLFAITNEASEALAVAQPNATLETYIDALGYFVVTPGVYFEADFTGKTVKSLNGANLTLSGFGTGTTMVNDAIVVRSDIFATNGVLHVLNKYVVDAVSVVSRLTRSL